ncbi:ubiquitin-like protein, putative [Plasmodium berghei]|uniref:Ubiquitin-like protein, putative n=2 Tax=Plasmodium berghei TaxID=5821 RepID=A0A509ATV6_PLABA|nr:ubiquitin-like protein, putative [Plasmodium berghei ANKA]CXJ13694.1 ubiquitin-like protein, putative [Plasmodium berghei]SCM26149.1 ubiquitin-like protein, putative [Plasmodium berghei]SCN28303.1 ubiquitin-like protein, putative [Plasmodium berghei]SCO62501.1 ubiquitin-like protein, putative [Plasmodium berghei]SCO64059.1 ubiquitin-like protein, putative [Plasmodium berghei]|eukprot:XP_034423955.1 ubiquitin-like protein, putative [Plasmodium berghei ANKA]
MKELEELCKYKNTKETKTINIKNVGNFIKKIEYEDYDIIDEVLRRNELIKENKGFLYQFKKKIIDLKKTFSYYKIKPNDTIYVLPEPPPSPFLIYLFHQISGKMHCIELNHLDSVAMLKKHVEKKLKIKDEDQILIYNDKCINNKKSLQEEFSTREVLVTILDKHDIQEIENDEI